MKRLLLIGTLLLTACGQLQLPRPECDPKDTAAAVLHCGEAVRAALGALSWNHPTITRIQFLYGSLRWWQGGFPNGDQPTNGYVVFTWANGSRRQYVDLTVWHGALTVGKPTPY
jgi:hypothetical protein